MESFNINTIATIARNGAKLMVAPVPRCSTNKSSFANDITLIQEKNVKVIICLLRWDELTVLGLEDYPEQIQKNDFIFYHFPLCADDLQDCSYLEPITHTIIRHLKAGDNVLIHCRNGLDRAGTVCACCLVQYRFEPKLAIEAVRKRRNGAISKGGCVKAVKNYYKELKNESRSRGGGVTPSV